MLLLLDKNEKAKEYDDAYDIVIHCESAEERERVYELITNPLGVIGEEIKKDIINRYGRSTSVDCLEIYRGCCEIIDNYVESGKEKKDYE